MRRSLSACLEGRLQPAGYVSFLSALVHHEALVDSLAVVQVASPDRTGADPAVVPGPVDFLMIPRDLYFGWTVEPFEGDVVPVASAEKALVDWLWFCEETGLDPRLDEIEWDAVDRAKLERLAAETGVELQRRLDELVPAAASAHEQSRLRSSAYGQATLRAPREQAR